MRIPILFLLVSLTVCLGTDIYVYRAALKRCRSKVPSRIMLFSSLALYLLLVVGLLLPARTGESGMLLAKMWMLFSFMTFLAAKVTFVIVDLIGSVPRLFGGERSHAVSLAAGILAVIVFLAMWWGALINRYSLDVRETEVKIPDLPAAFNGFRIVQISDLHVGTFGSDPSFVNKLVATVNELQPDMIVFTGDIVNRYTDEILPFVEPLSRLFADHGVYSILGNHDYGDYYDWDREQEKQASLQRLIDIQRGMGWHLLLNSSRKVGVDGDTIVMVGVENVGDPPFKNYGDLRTAYPDLSDRNTKILLTHNPAHWDAEVADNDNVNIALTLSGHTHAMQISFLGFSPSAWRYRHWGGLYRDEYGEHQLYVNIGAGTVGMPMRLGATPEITVITLRRGINR